MKSRIFCERLIFGAACLGFALNVYFLLRPGSFGWNLAKALRNPNDVMHTIGPVDRVFADQKANTNTFLGFEHLTSDNEHLVEMLYYRACYAAYPAKVFVAPSGTVINRSKDFLSEPFEPNEDWLNDNRVGQELIYDQKPNGNIKASVMTRHIR